MNWKEQLADKWWRVKVADNALQTMKDRVEFNTIARLTKKQQDGTLGRKTDEQDAVGDMYLGDVVNTKTSTVAPALVGGLGGAALALAAAWWMMQPPPTTSTPPATSPPPVIEPAPLPNWQQQGFLIKPGAPAGWQKQP